MYLAMYVAWFLLQYLIGTSLAAPMPQYLELLSNADTTITVTISSPPMQVVSNAYLTMTITEGVVGTAASAADPPSLTTPVPIAVASTSTTPSSTGVALSVSGPASAPVSDPPSTTLAPIASSPPVVIPPPLASSLVSSTCDCSGPGMPVASPAASVSPPPVVTAFSSAASNPSSAAIIYPTSAQSQLNVILGDVLVAFPPTMTNQAPTPNVTVPLPLISSFPTAADPTPLVKGSHQVVSSPVPSSNITIIATIASPTEAPAISRTAYEYTVGSMQYYISRIIDSTSASTPLNVTQDPLYWDIGYGCWVEFSSNPVLGTDGQRLLTYGIIRDALQGMKVVLLENGWWYLAFIEIRQAPDGLVVGYATVSPNLAPNGTMPIQNIHDALEALKEPVGGGSKAAQSGVVAPTAPTSTQGASILRPGATVATAVNGGAAHRRRSWRWR